MLYLIAITAGVVLVIGAGVIALVRRDRRRLEPGADTLRIENTATRGFHESRRQARAEAIRASYRVL